MLWIPTISIWIAGYACLCPILTHMGNFWPSFYSIISICYVWSGQFSTIFVAHWCYSIILICYDLWVILTSRLITHWNYSMIYLECTTRWNHWIILNVFMSNFVIMSISNFVFTFHPLKLFNNINMLWIPIIPIWIVGIKIIE